MSRKNVLVVDDDDGIVETMKDVLESSGYDVDTASNGSDAVELVKENDYGIILMDIRMPGMNGLQAYKRMREGGKTLNVVFITAFTDDETASKIKTEACPVLYKPVDMVKLMGVVKMTR